MSKISVNKIESSVPIPVRRGSVVPIRELKVGHSVRFPLDLRPNVQSLASRIKKNEGKEFTVSKISDTECRVWRTK